MCRWSVQSINQHHLQLLVSTGTAYCVPKGIVWSISKRCRHHSTLRTTQQCDIKSHSCALGRSHALRNQAIPHRKSTVDDLSPLCCVRQSLASCSDVTLIIVGISGQDGKCQIQVFDGSSIFVGIWLLIERDCVMKKSQQGYGFEVSFFEMVRDRMMTAHRGYIRHKSHSG